MSRKDEEFSGRAERLISLLQELLSAKTVLSPIDLAEKYGTSLRTIERYLEILRGKFDIPILSEVVRKRHYYRLDLSKFSFGNEPMSSDETDALFMSAELIKLLPGTHFVSGMNKLLLRLKPLVTDETFANMLAGIRVHTGPVTDLSMWHETITIITKSIRHNRKIDVVYTSRSGGNKTKHYSLSPFTLFFHPDGLYLVGRKEGETGLRVWAIHRMSSVKLLREKAESDPEYDFEKRFSLSLGAFQGGGGNEVTLKISGEAFNAFRVMRLPPIIKKIFPAKGIMELTFRTAGFEELKRLILSYPNEVEVLSPALLRKDIANTLKNALKKY